MKTGLYLAVISNVIFEPYFVPSAKRFFGNSTTVLIIPFEEYTNTEYQLQLASADMIAVWLNLENMLPELYFSTAKQDSSGVLVPCKKLFVDLTSVSQAKILWFSFEKYAISLPVAVGHTYHVFLDKLNLSIRDILADQATLIDLKYLIAEVGISNAYDLKGKYRWNAPYSKMLIEAAVAEIHKQYLIEQGITKKCLVLDCDNVLWGGVLSEDGVENLKLSGSGLGRVYQDFQRFVLSLYYHGVILAVCSKNDLPDVLTMFRRHSEMVLKEEHIASFQVNWESKINNIKRISEELNIGLGSMVFVDDSLAEIEAVKVMLPEVTVIPFKRAMEYEQFSCFYIEKSGGGYRRKVSAAEIHFCSNIYSFAADNIDGCKRMDRGDF